MAQEIDFYPREIYHCRCLICFWEDVYTQHCLRSINEITEALKKEQDIMFKCWMFMIKKLKKTS